MTAPVDVLAPAPARLEPIHVEVLDLVADGLRNDVIARRLGLRPDTVATRLKDAAKVLGSGDRTTMVAECYRRGVFKPKPADGDVPVVGASLLPLLALLARGSSYAGCAKALGIDEWMVKRRAPSLYRLLGAVNGTHLPRRAVDFGLLPADLGLAALKPAPAPVVSVRLSPEQERVLRMLASGLEPDAIAMRIGMSPGAVRETARGAMAALRARTLPHAVLLACQAGILPGGGS